MHSLIYALLFGYSIIKPSHDVAHVKIRHTLNCHSDLLARQSGNTKVRTKSASAGEALGVEGGGARGKHFRICSCFYRSKFIFLEKERVTVQTAPIALDQQVIKSMHVSPGSSRATSHQRRGIDVDEESTKSCQPDHGDPEYIPFFSFDRA